MKKNKVDSGEKLPLKGIKIAAISLGCSKNRVDTEEALHLLVSLGSTLINDYNAADIIIVNTCSFISEAQKESVDTLLEVGKITANSRAKLVVSGCLVELYGSKLLKLIPELSGAIGAHSYRDLPQFIKIILSGRRAFLKKKPVKDYCRLPGRILTTPPHSVSVKIAEGCSNRCHYCLIPEIRGFYRSRPAGDIVDEIKLLVERGTREIILIAQDTTAYGNDRAGFPDLAGLIKMIMKIDHDFWLRIMYTYPSRIDDNLIGVIASEERVCNYLDIPFQHISDPVLEKMNRHYRMQDLVALIRKLRNRIPDIAVRTTVMVGFPGERKAFFDELIAFIEEYNLEHIGAFTYSAQEGTEAFRYPMKIPQRVAKKRYRILMEKQQQIALELNRRSVGKILPVIVDRPYKNNGCLYIGRTEYQAPEVDGYILLRSNKILEAGTVIKVRICAASTYNLLAVISSESIVA